MSTESTIPLEKLTDEGCTAISHFQTNFLPILKAAETFYHTGSSAKSANTIHVFTPVVNTCSI